MKIYKTVYIVSLLFLFTIKVEAIPTPPTNVPATPVTDFTAANNFVQQFNALQQMIEHNTAMALKLGKGEITPATINWAGSWYQKCGGGKYVLPDWFPHPKLDICASPDKTLDTGVKWFEKEMLVFKTDPLPVAQEKAKKQEKAKQKVRAYSLTKSSMEMQRAEENTKAIEKFQQGLKDSKDIVSVQKVQTQIIIQMLAELQKMNIQQAEIIYIMSIRE